ncbi:MAG: ATP synthase subunit I [Clostridia bacterium]|nr:ATP synthase subunit I [Clostridia bacterium]
MKNRIDPTVRRETGHVALWVAVSILPVQAVFLLLRQWDYAVLLGSLLGGATAIFNFLLVGLMIQKALAQTEKQAKNTVRLSQGGRLLLQGMILVLAAVLPCFNIWAAAIPLLVPRVAVSVRAKLEAKRNPSPDRPAIGWEDEEDEEEDDED